MIPSHALHNFQINSDDDEQTVLIKRYYQEHNRIWNKTYNNFEQHKRDFDDKYNKIIKMKSKTPIEQLKLEAAICELLN